jgi:F-type H+-transporting ATPase subunit d
LYISSSNQKAVKLDWARIISTLGLTGSTASSLQAFRKRHDDAKKKVFDLSNQSTEVDFSHYRSLLKNQKVVDEIEQAFKSFKPVTYDVSKQLKTIEAFEAKALENARDTEDKVVSELNDLQATLDNIQSARPFDQLTVTELTTARPEIDDKVYELLRKKRYEVPGYEEKFGSTVIM